MNTPTTPKTVRGKISPKGISKADRFFSGNLRTAFIELLQNSRRAGATRVTCNVRQVSLSEKDSSKCAAIIEFIDDGPGVAEPQILFDLLDSGWNAQTQANEDPAGAGFFSLAGLSEKVEIASHDWRVVATRAVFVGEAEALVVPAAKRVAGLYLKFEVPGNEYTTKPSAIKSTLEDLSEFGTLRVVFNGEPLERRDFLYNCFHVVERDGLRIGFYFDGSSLRRTEEGKGGRVTRAFSTRDDRINFYGVQLHPREIVPDADGLGRQGDWAVGVCIDIKETSAIKMTLPQRDAIVENTEWLALLDWLRIEVYRQGLPQFNGHHRLSFKEFTRLERAGLVLDEAVPALRQWHSDAQSSSEYSATYPEEFGNDRPPRVWLDRPTAKPILLLDDVGVADRGLLISIAAALFANAGGEYQPLEAFDPDYDKCDYLLLQSATKFEGYAWYDKIPRVSKAVFTLTPMRGKKHSEVFDLFAGTDRQLHKTPHQSLRDKPGKHLRSILVTLQTASTTLLREIEENPNDKKLRPTTLKPMHTPFFIHSVDAYSPDECCMWLSNDVNQLLDHAIACDLVGILMICGYSYSDDSDDDCEEQQEYAEEEAVRWVRGCLFGPLDGIVAAIRKAMDDDDLRYSFYGDWMQAGVRRAVIEIDLTPAPKFNADSCVGIHLTLTDKDKKVLTAKQLRTPVVVVSKKKAGNKKAGKVSS